jgi:hypothetical protein
VAEEIYSRLRFEKDETMDQITLENVYPLTRRQEALLEQGYAPDASELTETWDFVLRGQLAQETFTAAWERVCERHRALCTALVWKRVERPLQVVQRKARLPLKYYDWRELTPAQQFAEFVKLIRNEHEQGFNAAQAPLVRLSLCRTAGDEYQVVCSYSSLLFDRDSIVTIFNEALRTYAEIADGDVLASRGEKQPNDESFYGEVELKLDQSLVTSQLHRWNQTEREYGRERSIAAVFEEQVQQRPDAVAVVMGDESLTYEQLNRRANQLAHYLRELGVGPEVCVGLCVERSLEMVVGLLGILKAGGAYVPLDAAYPTERLAYMLADAGVAVVLTQESLVDVLPLHWGQVVSLDSDWEQIGERSDENPESGATGENLAYVMYTSGSTGEP